jgi:hypothetical protein
MPQSCSICIHYKTTVFHRLYDIDHKGRLHFVNLYSHWLHYTAHNHCAAMKRGSTHWVQPLWVTGFPRETTCHHMMVCSELWKQLEIPGFLSLSFSIPPPPLLIGCDNAPTLALHGFWCHFVTLFHTFWAKHCNRSHHKHSLHSLQSVCNARIIRRDFWPSCLLYLKSCYFYLWGMLKDKR